MEWSANYIDPNNPIGVPKSCHEGSLADVGVLEKMAITPNPKAYDQAHFLVLQQMSKVCRYVDEHKQMLLEENSGQTEAWVARQRM